MSINTNGSWVVIATRQPPNLATLVEIDQNGNERFGIEFDADANPSLNVRHDGLYESRWLVNGASTRVLYDPATGEVVNEISAVAFGDERWGDLVVVEADGAVAITRGPVGDREPTGIVLDPNVQAVALVADQIVAYQDDHLQSFALDGSEVWRADYDGDFMLTKLLPVAPGSSKLAVITSPRVDVIDVATQTLVLSTTMQGAAHPNQWSDRLVAAVQPMGAGSVALLDLSTGALSISQNTTGRLIADPAGVWLDVPSINGAQNQILGLTPDGGAIVGCDTPARRPLQSHRAGRSGLGRQRTAIDHHSLRLPSELTGRRPRWRSIARSEVPRFGALEDCVNHTLPAHCSSSKESPRQHATRVRLGELGRGGPALSRVGIGFTARARSVRVGSGRACSTLVRPTSLAVGAVRTPIRRSGAHR